MKILIGSSYVFRLLSWASISKIVMNSHTFKSFLPFWGRYYSNNYYYQPFGHFSWELCLTECANVLIKQARFLVSSGIMLA